MSSIVRVSSSSTPTPQAPTVTGMTKILDNAEESDRIMSMIQFDFPDTTSGTIKAPGTREPDHPKLVVA